MNILSEDGLKTLISNIKAYIKEKIPTKTSQLTNDSGYIDTVYANNIKWGGNRITDGVSPIGMALSDELRANRFAFINPDVVTVEYSTDSGATWLDYGKTNEDKQLLFTKTNSRSYIGSTTSNGGASLNKQTRITLTLTTQQQQYLYTHLYKLLILFNTNGHSCEIKIETRTGDNYISDKDEWATIIVSKISGWSGWNDIPLDLIAGGSVSQTNQIWQIRFTFYYTNIRSDYKDASADIRAIYGYGSPCWHQASTMGGTGHLHSYDMNQNVTFPAEVTATNFKGKINGYTIDKSVPSDAQFTDTTYDLTPYAKTVDVDTKLATKADKNTSVIITLPSDGWKLIFNGSSDVSGSTYRISVPVEGITEDDDILIDIYVDVNAALGESMARIPMARFDISSTAAKYAAELAKVQYAAPFNGEITFYRSESALSMDVPLIVRKL